MNVKEWFRREIKTAEWVSLCTFPTQDFEKIWDLITTDVIYTSVYTEILKRYSVCADDNNDNSDCKKLERNTVSFLRTTPSEWFAAKMKTDEAFHQRILQKCSNFSDFKTFEDLWSQIASLSTFTELYRDLTEEHQRSELFVVPKHSVEAHSWYNSIREKNLERKLESERLELQKQRWELQRIDDEQFFRLQKQREQQIREDEAIARRMQRVESSIREPIRHVRTIPNDSFSAIRERRQQELNQIATHYNNVAEVDNSVKKVYNVSKTKTRLQDNIVAWNNNLRRVGDLHCVGECFTCLEYAANVVFSPCRHTICSKCAFRFFVTQDRTTCQLCAREVSSVKNFIL